MTPRQLVDILKDQRGVALPLAMLALVVMSVLIIGFSLLSASEPNIANNQLRVAQARAIAEAGMERAIWALNNNDNGIIASSLAGTAAAPYDGSQLITVSVGGTIVGGFRVTVTNGAAANLRDITADGWVPNDTANPRAKQRIRVTASQFLFAGNPPPSALTVRGEIEAGGNATIDSRADTSCGDKPGTWSKGITAISGSANIWGHDNNNIANQGTDAIQNMPDASFDPYTLHNADLNSLKALAKKNGTYYQGTVLFNAGHNLPNGIIYVDTVSGNNIDASGPNTTPVTDFAAVDISGSAPAATDPITGRPTFSGMLIVAGTLVIHGDFEMHGLVYVQNDFTYLGTGTGQIDGAVISQNVRDVSATSIDTNALGNSLIKWNCSYAKNPGGLLPPTFNVSPGTYKEVSG